MTLTKLNSKGIKDDEILNADINASAAIAGSKLNPVGLSNVGIGTSNPSDNLEISSTVPTIRLTDTDGGPSYSQIKGPGNGDLRISCDVGNTSSSASEIQFDIHDSNKMVIQSTGNVGIGTPTPTVTLDIEATTPTIRLTDSDASGTPECEIKGGGGDLIFSADRDDEKSGTKIQFQTDGSTKITIDEVGRLGVGTTSPSGFNAYGNTLVAATSTNTGLTLSGNDASTNYSGLHFAAGTTVRGYLDQQLTSTGRMQLMNMAAGYMAFGTSNTVRMTIGSTGDVELTENLKVASGKGINFSAYATSGNPSSNLLDDYEEGTWTPTFKYWTGSAWADVAFSNTPVTTNAGLYTKIGNVVHFSYYTENFVVTTGAGSTASIQNLPFTHASGSFTAITCSHWNGMGDNENAFIFGNTKEIRFTQEDSIDQASWGSGLSHIMISGTYRVA